MTRCSSCLPTSTPAPQMESVAQRQLERQAKVLADNTTLQARLDTTQEEIKKVRGVDLEARVLAH